MMWLDPNLGAGWCESKVIFSAWIFNPTIFIKYSLPGMLW